MVGNQIPKLIHYVWLGGSEKPRLMLHCMESWEKYCPDYQLMEWDDERASKIDNQFLKEAIENKKWAFAADFLRLYALREYGGFYFDADLEITANLDSFRKYKFVIGFENEKNPSTAFIGSEKKGRVVEALIDYYSERRFVLDDGSLDQTTNPGIYCQILTRNFKQWRGDRDKQRPVYLSEEEIIFPESYFCRSNKGEPNFAIHHFSGSWVADYTTSRLMSVFGISLYKVKQRNKFFDMHKFISECRDKLWSFEYKKNKFFILTSKPNPWK